MESYCLFELRYYPFDSQNCQIILTYQGNEGDNIELIEDKLSYLGPITMKQYDIDVPIQFQANLNEKWCTPQKIRIVYR